MHMDTWSIVMNGFVDLMLYPAHTEQGILVGALIQLNNYCLYMSTLKKSKGIGAFFKRKITKLKRKTPSSSAPNVSNSTSSMYSDNQSLHAEPKTAQMNPTPHEGDVIAAGHSQPLEADQPLVIICPTNNIHTSKDATTPGPPQSATPKPLALQALTSALKTLHNAAEVFLPLQAAIGGLVACIEWVEVGDMCAALTAFTLTSLYYYPAQLKAS
ncbi:hypothetical protein RhiTH_010232 [Rhizoctonia solani]